MFEDQKCGECKQNYSQKCKKKKKCQFHNGVCFQCTNCVSQIIINPKKCNKCQMIFTQSELYYDHQCNQYFCKYEFIKAQKKCQNMFIIPCKNKHQESISHLYNFMRDFCYWCGRKIIHKDLSFQDVIVCQICFSMNYCQFDQQEKKKSKQQQQQQKQTEVLQTVQTIVCQQISSPVQLVSKITAQQLNEDPQININLQTDLQSAHQIIQILKEDLRLSQQKRMVQYISRNSIEKIILNPQRIIHCSVCLIDYHFSQNPPYMICTRQHLLCGKCFPLQQKCPQCCLKIDKQNILQCRLKTTFLQLQSLISKKFEQTVKGFKQRIMELQKKQNLALVKTSQLQQRQQFLTKKENQILQKQKLLLQKENKTNQNVSVNIKRATGSASRGRPKGSSNKK